MEELQDAIEDAQYVNAINTQDDGPKPVLAWDKPSPEAMVVWAAKKKWDIDSFLESAIAFFLFSSYIKTKHDDYLRINFCEDVLRFKRMRGRTRRKQAQFVVENYCRRSSKPEGEASANSSITKPLPRTEIDESDLERKIVNLKSNVYLKEDSSFRIYCDYPKCSQTVIGIRDAVLEDLVDDWREWEEQDRKAAAGSVYRHSDSNSLGSGDKRASPRKLSLGVLSKPEEEKPTKSNGEQPKPDEEKPKNDQVLPTTELEQPKGTDEVQPKNDDTQPKTDEVQPKSTDEEKQKDGESAPTAVTVDGTGTANSNEDVTVSPPVPAAMPIEQPKNPPQMSNPATGTPRKTGSASEYDDATASMRVLTQKFKSQNEAVHDTLFDKAETVVMESLRRDYWELFLQSEEFEKARNFLWYLDRPVMPDDFYIMRVLGRGGFGLVNACKKGTSGKLYAMKMMNKRRIKMKKSEQLAVNERAALAAVESNFVVNLKYSFHSKDDVYLILDLMTGGDLGFHLHQKGRFPKREVQYYAARIMLGLQALHDKGYVYRDLKPENCLLADDGRVKITDLGLATRITPNLHGAAGTRGYWAPEMLRRDRKGKRIPYGHTVDWFSFGCCVTEFICGANPFRSEAALNFGLARGKQTKEKAIDCATLEMEPDFPNEFFEPDAKDLCMCLLEKDEKLRMGTGGCEEIMAHPYFKNLNWEAIIADKKRPPFIPARDVNAASQSEIGNFVEDKTYQETVVTEQDEAFYRDWDWTNPRAYATEVIEFLIYERETGEPLLPMQQNAGCCCVVL